MSDNVIIGIVSASGGALSVNQRGLKRLLDAKTFDLRVPHRRFGVAEPGKVRRMKSRSWVRLQ